MWQFVRVPRLSVRTRVRVGESVSQERRSRLGLLLPSPGDPEGDADLLLQSSIENLFGLTHDTPMVIIIRAPTQTVRICFQDIF
jgi:hypothetical protein